MLFTKSCFFFNFIYQCYLFKPDIIHALPFVPNLFARLAKLFLNTTVICEFHGTAYVNQFKLFIDKIFFKQADLWIFVSQDVKSFFFKHWGINTKNLPKPMFYKVINNFVDNEMFKFDQTIKDRFRQSLGIDSQSFTIGIAARLDRLKRVDLLINATSGLINTGLDIVLVVCGQGVCKQELQELGLKSIYPHRIIFIELTHCQMPDFYSAIDLLVLTSDSEGVSSVLLEAASSGCAILIRDTLLNQRCLFSKKPLCFSDEDELKKRILDVLKTKESLNRTCVIKKRYFKKNIVAKYRTIYEFL